MSSTFKNIEDVMVSFPDHVPVVLELKNGTWRLSAPSLCPRPIDLDYASDADRVIVTLARKRLAEKKAALLEQKYAISDQIGPIEDAFDALGEMETDDND